MRQRFLTFLSITIFAVTSVLAEGSTDYLCFTTDINGASVSFDVNGIMSSTPNLQYSTDGSDWSNYSFGTVLNLSKGEKVWFRANDISNG